MTAHTEKLTREEVARREVGHTDISDRLARVMTILFLMLICIVPLGQHAVELAGGFSVPQMYNICKALPEAGRKFRDTGGSPYRKILSANALLLHRINAYEDELESTSVLTKSLLGPTQLLLAKRMGLGNENAYLGLEGWLFFRPGVDHLIGPAFLDERRLRKRRLSGNEYTSALHPDPRKAIIDFHNQMKTQGIVLIVLPTPVKPALHPEMFSTRYGIEEGPIRNGSYKQFIDDIRKAGVKVFDPAPVLRQAIDFSGMPQFLDTDTHWTPGAMEITAKGVADAVRESVRLSPQKREYLRSPVIVTNLGDVAVMMNLPEGQGLFKKQTVSVMQVSDGRTGSLWRPIRTAEILVLGDSFSNIYSLGVMGWGQSAGFAEQMSYFLQRPVDAIIQNDSGAYATREALAARLARGDDAFAGKKVVVWQFATRELSFGDWRPIKMQ